MKKVILVTTFHNSESVLGQALVNLLAARNAMKQAGYQLDVQFVDDASTDGTVQKLMDFSEKFPGNMSLLFHVEALGRGPCFIEGLRAGLRMLGESAAQDTIMMMVDLCAKAPHDPGLFPEHLNILEENEGAVIVGSTLYESRTLDDVEMRQMGHLQWCSLCASGDSFHIQNPAYQIGKADYFRKALRYYDRYASKWSEYTDEEWPGPGVPGVVLTMLTIAGASLFGVTLPVYGEWRPNRPWRVLEEHAKATMLHLEVAQWMLQDDVFDDVT